VEGSRVLCSVLQLVFSRLVCSMESRGYFSLTKHGRLRAEIVGRDAPLEVRIGRIQSACELAAERSACLVNASLCW